MFAEYENYLNEVKEFDNYWSDVGISEAVSMLEKFSANDWQMLNEKIQDKSKVWLVSCAETLGDDVGGGSSFDLLLKLLSSEINEVKIAALDSIIAAYRWALILEIVAGKFVLLLVQREVRRALLFQGCWTP